MTGLPMNYQNPCENSGSGSFSYFGSANFSAIDSDLTIALALL